jgi:hypothetical protein
LKGLETLFVWDPHTYKLQLVELARDPYPYPPVALSIAKAFRRLTVVHSIHSPAQTSGVWHGSCCERGLLGAASASDENRDGGTWDGGILEPAATMACT